MNENIGKPRETLKGYFKNGKLPSERHFHELIDSTLNMADEGFSRTDEDGIRVVAQRDQRGLLSFSGDLPAGQDWQPAWRLELERRGKSLQFVPGKDPDEDGDGDPQAPILTLAPDGVGIGTKQRKAALDVAGVVRSEARIGIVPPRDDLPEDLSDVVADGEWHAITPVLHGCQLREVAAGVGHEASGRWALFHGVAMAVFPDHPQDLGSPIYNAFSSLLNSRPVAPIARILGLAGKPRSMRVTQATWRNRKDRLRLRWKPEKGGSGYRLEIRTHRAYPDPPRIRYHVTDLWEDEGMRGSQATAHAEAADVE